MAANVTFDGATKIIQVDPGITQINIREVYSEWKRWVRTSDNTKWLQAFDIVGGDDLGAGLTAPIYHFLINGWRIRPDGTSGAHTLFISTNLYSRPSTADKYDEVAGVSIEVLNSDTPGNEVVISEDELYLNAGLVSIRL